MYINCKCHDDRVSNRLRQGLYFFAGTTAIFMVLSFVLASLLVLST